MKQLTTIALIGISYFVVVIVALHFLRDDLSPMSNPTSQYAVGRYGFLMTTAFFSMSVASFSLLIGLYKRISKPAQSSIGLTLLGIWAVGVLVAMLFPLNPEGTEATTTSVIHRINGPLVFLSLSIGAILVSRSFRRDKNWRPFYPTALTLSFTMLLFFIITGINVALKSGFEGLCQRVFLVVFSTWFILTAMHLRSLIMENNIDMEKNNKGNLL
jgi:uncharacterized membrane protein YozB (DUF420 family)